MRGTCRELVDAAASPGAQPPITTTDVPSDGVVAHKSTPFCGGSYRHRCRCRPCDTRAWNVTIASLESTNKSGPRSKARAGGAPAVRRIISQPPLMLPHDRHQRAVRAGAKRVVYRIEDLDAWQERHLEHVGPGRESDMCEATLIDVPGGSVARKVMARGPFEMANEQRSCYATFQDGRSDMQHQSCACGLGC
jgi:hypothetical protein